jgi:phosphoribosylglycinamide formyltransferase-1
MRVLGPEIVRHYEGRLINIHPALLPSFPGLDTHRRAIDAGVQEHGASVHFVTDEVDGGPVILRARVPVLPGDTPETLAARVLEQEHRIYPEVIRWFAEGRLHLDGTRVLLDGRPVHG